MESDKNFTDKIFSLAHGFRLQKGGIVGRLCYVAIAIIMVVGGVSIWAIPPDQRIWMLLGLAGLVVFILLLIFIYGLIHPQMALLEGAEILKREELLIASKGKPSIPLEAMTDEILPDPYPSYKERR
jgi:hypothetical protein